MKLKPNDKKIGKSNKKRNNDSSEVINEVDIDLSGNDNSSNLNISNEVDSHDQTVHSEVSSAKEKDEDEDEVLVYVNFSNFNESDYISKAPSIELDLDSLFTANPRCTVRDVEFTGTHELSLGTSLFISQSTSESSPLELKGISSQHIDFRFKKIRTESLQNLKKPS